MENLPSSPLMAASDKAFWHAYVDFYARHFPADIDGLVVEFGVLNGNSIRWLSERFPSADLVGVDILPVQATWPQGPRIRYAQVDQDSEAQMAAFFAGIAAPRLIIEDGSHFPRHQSRCLAALDLPRDRVPPDQRAAAAAAGVEAIRQHGQHGLVAFARQCAVRVGTAHASEQRVFTRSFARPA